MEKHTEIHARSELFTRGVGEFVDPEGTFVKKIQENPSSVVIKLGVDPTRPDIHLGHAVVLRKLRTFQDMGCKVIFLIGDLTAQIGDPTGKSKVRPEISQAEIEVNMKSYLDQVGRILRTEPDVFSWIRNSDWFVGITDIVTEEGVTIELDVDGEKVVLPPLPANDFLAKTLVWQKSRMQKQKVNSYSLINVLAILRGITFQRLIGRDMFQERIKSGTELYMHEMMYPVLQGIDSTVLHSIYGSCDLEVGGTDQTFNMLVGRDVMKMNKQTPQSVIAFDLLEGLDGKEKMSKSLDNYVGITDEPSDMFGKIMSIPDTLIIRYFTLCTYRTLADIADIEKRLSKENPRDIKMQLAREIVEIYHGKGASETAQNSFIETFSKGGIPEEIIEVESNGKPLVDVLMSNGLIVSKTEYRRLLEAGAVEDMESGQPITDIDFVPKQTIIVRVGKKRFLKIKG